VVHRKVLKADAEAGAVAPAYTHRLDLEPIPKFKMPLVGARPEVAYRLIHDELLLDGSSRLNLATFVTTWMEPEADRLMAEAFDKNMIDKDEYPQTAEIERRCVNMVAHLFHAPDDPDADSVGASTIGSSEAVMLAGLAMKWTWRAKREAQRKDTTKPNLILGSNVQVVWEKFCRYWDVEPRYIPVHKGRYVIDPDEVIERIDENTIGVVAILGTTYTGEFEPIEDIHDAIVANNAETGFEVPLHIDAASGGFVAPFLHPHLKWDFRLPNIVSINVSGHKYGLVYPGVGFVVWRSAAFLPDDLVFHVNYLGGDMPTFTLNFSRPGNQIVGQYYNFLRLGHAGYALVMHALRDLAVHTSSRIAELGPFELLSDGSATPVFAFAVKEGTPFTVFDVSDRLRAKGWQVPAYTMPDDATDVAVLRVVVREGFSFDLADDLLADLSDSVAYLREHPAGLGPASAGFSHT
jgi:glutamate decarboxylase